MATRGTDNLSDEIIDNKCSVCVGKNITREAEKYCVECQDYYCIPCTDTHKAFPVMRGHQLLDKSDFKTHRTPTGLPSYPTDRCPIHKAKLLDIFCENHDEVICSTCVAINHRSCRNIHSIPDDVDTLYRQPLSDKIRKELTEEKQQYVDIKQRKQHLLSKLKQQKKVAIGSILDYKKELENELKRLEGESIKRVEKEYGRLEQAVQNSIKEADTYIEEFEQSDEKIQKSKGNKAQEFVSLKAAQKIIRMAEESKEMIKRDVVGQIVPKLDTNILTVLKQTKVLTHLQETETKVEPKTTAYRVKQHDSYNAKMDSDRSCYLYGSCLLEDGSLLVTDTENKLKRIDTSNYTITDNLILNDSPIAVCQTSKQEVAVSLFNKQIAFVSLKNKMTMSRKLQMDHICSGIAYKDDKLFISDERSGVYIHDINGRMIHKITTDNLGQKLFRKTRHLTPSKDRDCMYVCDSKKGLITLDMKGNYISRFVDDVRISPFGVCTDGRGNLFVCSFNSPNIIQIREDSMKKVCVINTDPNPVSVCFDPNQSKLFVTHFEQDLVNVYKLE